VNLRIPALDLQLALRLGLLGACVLLGLLAGVDPPLAVAAAIGIVAAAIALTSATAAVAGFVIASMTFLGTRPTLMLLAAVAVVVSWLALVAAAPSRRVSLTGHHPWLVIGLIAFIAWIALSQLWAGDVQAVRDTVQRYLIIAVVFPAAFLVAQTRRGAMLLFAAFVAGAVLSAMTAIAGFNPFSSGPGQYGDRFVGGPVSDPNIFASLLLTGAAFAAAFATKRLGLTGPVRLAFAGSVLLLLAAVVATGSRGGLVALVAMLLCLPLLAGRYRAPATALVLALLAITLVSSTASWSPMAERFEEQGLRSSGRIELWTVGWQMFLDRPWSGVGAGNFRQESPSYLLQVDLLAEDEYIVSTPLVAHNSYLQLLSENGIPALVLFLAIVGYCLRCALRAAGNFRAQGDTGMELLSRALVISLVGFLVALVFLTFLDYGRPLWVLFALGPAVLTLSQRGLAAAEEPASPPEQPVRRAGGGLPQRPAPALPRA